MLRFTFCLVADFTAKPECGGAEVISGRDIADIGDRSGLEPLIGGPQEPVAGFIPPDCSVKTAVTA